MTWGSGAYGSVPHGAQAALELDAQGDTQFAGGGDEPLTGLAGQGDTQFAGEAGPVHFPIDGQGDTQFAGEGDLGIHWEVAPDESVDAFDMDRDDKPFDMDRG